MTRAPTGFLLHPAAPLHDPGWGHPEHQGRLPALAAAIEDLLPVLIGRVEQVDAPFATREELERVHPAAHLDRIEASSRRARDEEEGFARAATRTTEAGSAGPSGRADAAGRAPARPGPVLAGEETPVSGASWDAIRGSSGAAIEAVTRVAEGRLQNAFVATRPPGHHASATRAMGFCPVNHVAVAARHLQAIGAAEKVLIVDWDVHHGNGTQDLFWEDPTVFFLSLHQSPFYPGTGKESERGAGRGLGATLNVELPAGTDGPTYRRAFRSALDRARSAFCPDFVLVSAGYDGLAGDPIGGMRLEPGDYFELARGVMALAEADCGGRVVALLEGGYAPARTGAAAAATLAAFAGLDPNPNA